MSTANAHPYSLISQQLPVLRSGEWGEGDQDVARLSLSKPKDLGVLPCGFWLLARRSKGKEGQNNRTDISVSIYASFLYFVKAFSLERLLKLHLLAKRKNESHSIFQQPYRS